MPLLQGLTLDSRGRFSASATTRGSRNGTRASTETCIMFLSMRLNRCDSVKSRFRNRTDSNTALGPAWCRYSASMRGVGTSSPVVAFPWGGDRTSSLRGRGPASLATRRATARTFSNGCLSIIDSSLRAARCREDKNAAKETEWRSIYPPNNSSAPSPVSRTLTPRRRARSAICDMGTELALAKGAPK